MLIFDQLKKNDPQLRLLASGIFAGLLVLLAGLWWVQIVGAREYRTHLEMQSFRTVRVPAVRGKILDRNGGVLAENRPSYSVSLYLEDFAPQFRSEYKRSRPVRVVTNSIAFWRSWLGANRVSTQYVRLSPAQAAEVEMRARHRVASNFVSQISLRLQMPMTLGLTSFARHYEAKRALPYPVLKNLDAIQVARFQEQLAAVAGADLELQSTRVYPAGDTAAHVLGYLSRDDDRSYEGELATFSYRLPDYRGVVGIERGFDSQLRGRAGAKSVLVNNLGYRQTKNSWGEGEPGWNAVLTLDLRVQQAAERAMRKRLGSDARGAVVVMDVNSGDVLALVSSPSLNPNSFIQGFTPDELARFNDLKLRPQINRATQENYAPGSIFKPIVGLACLEAGLNDKESLYNPGHITVGRRYIHDTAPAGNYDFRRAIARSSNTYFITNGLRYKVIERVIELGRRLHLGERFSLPTRQEAAGSLPSFNRVRSGWFDGDTANICIGQGEIAVTPLQMAVMSSALANGGKVLWPRLVARLEPQDPVSTDSPVIFPSGRVRDQLGVNASYMHVLHEAMLAETEDRFEGTGRYAVVPGLKICGKTGTAQVTDARNRNVDQTTWFISFAPYEGPRYAVVVMVESGESGGSTCAPVAQDIYTALQKLEPADPPGAIARGN